jgi:hypothetical protein
MKLSLVVQNVSVLTCCGVVIAMLAKGHETHDAGFWILIVLLLAASVVSTLGSLAGTLAVEKDWVVVICRDTPGVRCVRQRQKHWVFIRVLLVDSSWRRPTLGSGVLTCRARFSLPLCVMCFLECCLRSAVHHWLSAARWLDYGQGKYAGECHFYRRLESTFVGSRVHAAEEHFRKLPVAAQDCGA